MRNLVLWAAFASAWLALSGVASADTDDAAARTTRFEIASDALDETREIYVRTPPQYDPEKPYPVVYVLDGEWNFEFVASYLDYLFDNEVYPDLIVTGVKNVNRNRDYVPAPDPHHPHTGEADQFLKFVKDEWIPKIEADYPASGKRILIGHSFGGVFTLHTFFKEPALFDAYIALGSSAWIADRVLFDEADALFGKRKKLGAFVYMAVGEGDGGPTVPSSKDLAAVFEEKAPANLEWSFSITPKTDHFTNVPFGMHEAFMKLFPAWGFADEVTARAKENGAEGVRAWFAEKEALLGWRFKPAWFDLSIAAFGLVREDMPDAGLALMSEMRRHYPDSAYIASFSGSIYERAQKFDEAEAETRRAIALAREQGLDPNAIQIAGLEKSLQEIETARSAGD